jgi:microcystin-dependent protein
MSDGFTGEIRMFAGAFAPVNWHFCDGSTLPISQYQALFALIGTTYGGDGSSTVGLPNMTGRTPIGTGTGTGLTARTLGQTGGEVGVVVTAAQMPAHTHTVSTVKDNATTDTPGNTVLPAASGTTTITLYTKVDASVPETDKVLNPSSILLTGGSQPHDNVMPSLGINFIICVNGLYPTQS